VGYRIRQVEFLIADWIKREDTVEDFAYRCQSDQYRCQ